MVIEKLVVSEFADGEVFRFRMRKVEAADAAAGKHGEALGEADAGALLGVEQGPDRALLGVVGLRGIAGRGADAAVFFADQLFGAEIFG